MHIHHLTLIYAKAVGKDLVAYHSQGYFSLDFSSTLQNVPDTGTELI
jgi:hypothetical protein